MALSFDLTHADPVLSSSAFNELSGRMLDAVAAVNSDRGAGRADVLNAPGDKTALADAEAFAARIADGADHILLLGTGGSALGAKALAAIAGGDSAGRLVVLDNLDPFTQADITARLDLARTHVLVISKSGSTAETMAQCLSLLAAYEAAGVEDTARFFAITEPTANPLARLAAERGWGVLAHHTGIGGRFAVFSTVGLVPGFLLGLDMAAFLKGAEHTYLPVQAGSAGAEPAIGAALCVAAMRMGLSQTVLMGYGDVFNMLTKWYRQLWAESLGKNGMGTTPIDALGPVDQHSQLQLYRAGPADKFYTLLTQDMASQGPAIPAAMATNAGLDYLAGRTVGDLVDAEQRATLESLGDAGRPVRRIHMPRLDTEHLGALMMHFMLETMLAAKLMRINAFDQPAVEDGKQRARDILKNG